MTAATVTDPRPHGQPIVGRRVELARYTISSGERVLYGQRINGRVRFLPDEPVVLDAPPASSEDSECCCRASLDPEERPDAARQKRPNDEDGQSATTEPQPERRGRTGARVELARYFVSAGERQLFGQRIFGVVRITDVAVVAGGRSYVVERELEQDGYGALKALVADYVRQARRLDAVPMSRCPL